MCCAAVMNVRWENLQSTVVDGVCSHCNCGFVKQCLIPACLTSNNIVVPHRTIVCSIGNIT